MRAYLVDLHEHYCGMTEGTLASTDASISLQTFGICAVSVDQGQVYEVVLEDWGREWVSRSIGMKPTDELSNAIALDETTHRPHNPLITTGAIATTSMIQGCNVTERLRRILQMIAIIVALMSLLLPMIKITLVPS